MNKEEKEAIEYIKFKTITGLETLQLEKDVKALEILLNYIDTLQEENKEYIDIFNSTEKIMNGQERTKDKLLKENVELKEQRDNAIKLRNELIEEQKITCVSKNKIRDKIKELEEELTQNYGTLGESLTTTEIKTLKKLLGE